VRKTSRGYFNPCGFKPRHHIKGRELRRQIDILDWLPCQTIAYGTADKTSERFVSSQSLRNAAETSSPPAAARKF
jgi:hypothetical protein